MDRFTIFRGFTCYSSEESPWRFYEIIPGLSLERSEEIPLCHAGIFLEMVPGNYRFRSMAPHLPLFGQEHDFPKPSGDWPVGFICHSKDAWSFSDVERLGADLQGIYDQRPGEPSDLSLQVHAFLYEITSLSGIQAA